ncbi:hypothetical protein CDAR_235141 [Caerostris darwini]|uniref:Uncharacterized protein n=1 Tax=Caerostris darwini TaxID=1538125 RepID=A0AAV4MQW7_9ARAC|nr:hypothetical protein CDAR_235141 [Caerostris darwini]
MTAGFFHHPPFDKGGSFSGYEEISHRICKRAMALRHSSIPGWILANILFYIWCLTYFQWSIKETWFFFLFCNLLSLDSGCELTSKRVEAEIFADGIIYGWKAI